MRASVKANHYTRATHISWQTDMATLECMPVQTNQLSDLAFVPGGSPRVTFGSIFVPHQTTLTKLDGGPKFEVDTKEHYNAIEGQDL